MRVRTSYQLGLLLALLYQQCLAVIILPRERKLLQENTITKKLKTNVPNYDTEPLIFKNYWENTDLLNVVLNREYSSHIISDSDSIELNDGSSREDIFEKVAIIKRSVPKETGKRRGSTPKKSQENNSSEDLSSDEVTWKEIVKRSLDSQQDTLNSLGKTSDGTNSKVGEETTTGEPSTVTTDVTTKNEEGTQTTVVLSETPTDTEQTPATTVDTERTEGQTTDVEKIGTTSAITEATEETQSSSGTETTAGTEETHPASGTSGTETTAGTEETQPSSGTETTSGVEETHPASGTETTAGVEEAQPSTGTNGSETTAGVEETQPSSGTESPGGTESHQTEPDRTTEILETTKSVTETTSTTETPTSESSDADTSEEEPSSGSTNSTSTEMGSSTPEEAGPAVPGRSFVEAAMVRVNKLSDQIRLVLYNYRVTNLVVIPGQTFFPDPMTMQDFVKTFSVGKMSFKNMRCYGLSNFTIEHVNTDVDRMQVYILLHMKRLVILGNYTLSTFWTRASGPFNVTLLDVDSEGVAEVATAPEGHLEATDSQMDMATREMKVDFRNMGLTGSFFQSAVGTVGDALFNSIKPQILERVNVVIRTDVNKKLKEFSNKFINKVAPVDLAFSEGRKYVKTHGYDPYHINDYSFLIGGLVHVNITEFWLEGLSKFYRVGNLSLSMDQGAIEIGVHVITENLKGRCFWSGQTFGIVKSGRTNFTVDHLQARATVTQSLDIRKKPQLTDLDLELGWVKVTMDSPMTLNLMIEGIINSFPRLIRHIIVDTLEQPLKEKIQEILDKINVESIVDENLPRLDNFGL